MRVFCDFDGTISVDDTTDLVLERFAGPHWEEIEAEWLAGRISAAECMRRQISLLKCEPEALDATLDAVPLAQGFKEFADWCAGKEIPLVIVSDGVEYFIRRILNRAGLSHLPVVANRLQHGNQGLFTLIDCVPHPGCAAGSGVCKCRTVQGEAASTQFTVYIGDGRSDFCVSAKADLLFARGKLAQYASARSMAHHEFSDFREIKATLDSYYGTRLSAAV